MDTLNTDLLYKLWNLLKTTPVTFILRYLKITYCALPQKNSKYSQICNLQRVLIKFFANLTLQWRFLQLFGWDRAELQCLKFWKCIMYSIHKDKLEKFLEQRDKNTIAFSKINRSTNRKNRCKHQKNKTTTLSARHRRYTCKNNSPKPSI